MPRRYNSDRVIPLAGGSSARRGESRGTKRGGGTQES